MAIVGSYLANSEREFFDDMIGKINRVFLSVTLVNFQGTHTGRIINCRILKTLRFYAFIYESQKLNIHLNVVAWHFFIVAFGVDFARSWCHEEAD